MRKITETKGAPVVGRVYLVPCLDTCVGHRVLRVPVFHHPHRDPELGFASFHAHYDYRFITDEDRCAIVAVMGTKTVNVARIDHATTPDQVAYSWEPRRCVRRWTGPDPLDAQGEHLSGVEALDDFCRDLVCAGDRCPHKGFDLGTVPRLRDGSRVCPLHGAKWDREGRYAPRINRAQRILARFLERHDLPDLASVPLEMHVFEAMNGRPRPGVTACDFRDCPGSRPAPFNARIDPKTVRIYFPEVKVDFRAAAHAAGYYIAHAGHEKVLWAEYFKDPMLAPTTFHVHKGDSVYIGGAF